MAKDFLAFLGLVFLILLVGISLVVVGYYYDALGLVDMPEVVPTTLARVLGPSEETLAVVGIGTAEWRNPMEDLPRATWAPSQTPQPTATPVLPLDPAEYRTEVLLSLRDFTAALEGWLDANRRLGQDNTLLENAAWRAEMSELLDEIREDGEMLGTIGPAPAEYQSIARLLGRLSTAAGALSFDYRRAMDTGDPKDFLKAGEDFERIKAYLGEAVQAMVIAGWSIE
jgi:hypothetical protein